MLDSEERIRELRPLELVRDIGVLANGMTAIDLGCGTGIFTLPMAKLVGDKGRVYAVDDSAEMLERVRAKNPPPNVRLLLADMVSNGIESQIADLCLLSSVLHEVEQPGKLMAETFRLLKPGGKVVVMDWKKESASPPGPPVKLRISRPRVERLIGRVGFIAFAYLDWSSHYYVATGQKVGQAPT
jgi:ubiquinone/menaquinone biosynthesis C-methylase UbiE